MSFCFKFFLLSSSGAWNLFQGWVQHFCRHRNINAQHWSNLEGEISAGPQTQFFWQFGWFLLFYGSFFSATEAQLVHTMVIGTWIFGSLQQWSHIPWNLQKYTFVLSVSAVNEGNYYSIWKEKNALVETTSTQQLVGQQAWMAWNAEVWTDLAPAPKMILE